MKQTNLAAIEVTGVTGSWCCGCWIFNGKLYAKNPSVFTGNTSGTCHHTSRERARDCQNRAELIKRGDGTTAINLRGFIVVPGSGNGTY